MIGLHVDERESADAPSVDAGSLGISAWAIRSLRGVVGKPRRVANLPEMKSFFFPEADPTFPAYYMLRALWSNCGPSGAVAYITRTIGAGSVTAKNFAKGGTIATAGAMTSSPSSFPADLFLPAGSTTFTGPVDGGAPGTATFTYTRATLTGSAATYAAVVASHTLDLTVGGVPVQVVFAGTENSQTLYLAAINAVLEGAAAVNSSGQLRLETDKYGSGASIAVLNTSSGDVLTSLGLAATSASGTGNVANARAVTATEFKTVFDAAFTGSVVVVNGDASVTWKSNTTGASSSVRLTGGTGMTPTVKVAGFNTTLHSGAASALDNIWDISAGCLGDVDPGDWPNGKLFFEVQAASSGLTTERDLVWYYQTDLDSAPVFKQRIKNVNNSNVVSKVNHTSQGSRWGKVALVGTPVALPSLNLGLVDVGGGTAGANGATPAESLYNARLQDFNGKDVQIVVAPDLQSLLQAQNLEAYSATRANTLSLTAAGHGNTDDDLESIYPLLPQAKSYLAGYRGWVEMDDERGGTIFVPPIGHIIGSGYIRKSKDNGGYAHIAPAGPTANFRDVISVDDGIYDQIRLARVNKTGFNPIVFQSGFGIFPKTSRTFSTQDKWYSIHVRIQANFFKVSFEGTFGILEQETNNESTRRRLRSPIVDFLRTQFSAGGIEQIGGFDNNAAVTCDTSNNTDEVVQQRRLVCDVVYRPSEVAEDIAVNLIRTTEGIQAKEV
ncbi:hypothetical protein KW797_01685 [Candidatus Parcubacteria bacterium]|nr:hypothetical protein [Candidatus Parcubacteria bacterium]